ncbi:MAG TPA: glycerol-3-phosphate responsive antiterminator, partial [Limnochordia bacterium]
MRDLVTALRAGPVIAGLKAPAAARRAIARGARVLFVLTGTLFDLREVVAVGREANALVFAHLDLLQGIGRDAPGLRFLAREVGVDGILTTRSFLIKAAKDEGL